MDRSHPPLGAPRAGRVAALVALAGAALSACKSSGGPAPTAFVIPAEPPDYPAAAPAPPVLISNATVMTAAGAVHSPGYVLMRDGKIAEVGPGAKAAPPGVQEIDAAGLFVTPGIIDTHSHMGVYPMPSVDAHEDGNEAVDPRTSEVWAEHSFWPQDPALSRALANGVTTIQVLPGSANLIGGRSFTAKLKPAGSARAMRFPGAPQGLKMACGENPKRVYGEKGGPSTRMGNVARVRAAFQEAAYYKRTWDQYKEELFDWEQSKQGEPPDPPERNFGLETLAKVLAGEILVHNHCYRADEMHLMLDLAKQFGFHIRSFHHALEAYKLRDRLAQEDVAVSTWADWWGFKLEAFDGIPQNAPMVAAAGGRAIMHSDSPVEVRYLAHEAAKARTAGAKVGLTFTDDQVLRWITANPAWALGIDALVGTLEPGKMADLVIWSGNPFSIYTQARQVFIDGALVFDRSAGRRPSDFELGLSAEEVQQ